MVRLRPAFQSRGTRRPRAVRRCAVHCPSCPQATARVGVGDGSRAGTRWLRSPVQRSRPRHCCPARSSRRWTKNCRGPGKRARRTPHAVPSGARVARLPQRRRVRDGSGEVIRAQRRARRNIPRRRQEVLRHAARQSRVARRRGIARRSVAAAAPHHRRTTRPARCRRQQ